MRELLQRRVDEKYGVAQGHPPRTLGYMRHSAAYLLPVVFFSVASFAQEVAPAAASREAILIGGKTIQMPAPQGFSRVDGLDAERDKIEASMTSPNNRLLARFEPPENAGGSSGRSFNAQVLKSVEFKEIGERTFADIRQETKKSLDASIAEVREKANKQASTAAKKIGDDMGVDMALELSDMAILGYFDENPSCLGFTMALNAKVNVGGKIESSKNVTASMIVPVNGRMLFLYALSDYHTPEDRQWAEKAVSAWRDAVVAANPRIEGPPGGFDFGQVGRTALIGGVCGGLIRLVSMLLKKFKKGEA